MRNVRIAPLVLFSAVLLLQGATGYKVIAHYRVPGEGSFDYVTLDTQARRLYLSHATQVDVIDADSGKQIGTIPDTPGVHGIALANAFKHGFTSNGREHKVSMFDPSTLQLIKKIDVGRGPDGIYFHSATKRIFTNNHGSHDVTAIDAETGQVVGTVKEVGDGEQAIVGSDGMIYVNSENTNDVVVFDPKSLEVKKRFPIGVAKVPTGLGYDPKTNRLFIGTRNEPKMVVMDSTNGKVITSFPIGAGVDWTHFDAESRLIFLSCVDGTLNIFHQKSADEYEDAGAVKTQLGAKTMAFDPMTKKIFLPAAEYDMKSDPADPSKPPLRIMRPGTFTVVVVGK